MSTVKADVLIIGAGLTGLTLAYLLRKKNIKVIIVEARDRTGGRIHTKKGANGSSIELGATWLGKHHVRLSKLIEELDLKIFEQKLGETAFYEPLSTSPPQLVILPENNDPSFRLVEGTSSLIDALYHTLDGNNIFLNEVIKSIRDEGDAIKVTSNAKDYFAKHLVSTLPPKLLVDTIKFDPKLSDDFLNVAHETHTWMGESIKIGLTYDKPFWRNDKMSGTIFSNVGPIPEMYDHTSYDEASYALKGFLNGVYQSVGKEERIEMVLHQLKKYYGNQVSKFLTYEEEVWCQEKFTYSPYKSQILPHQNNGDSIYQSPMYNGKLFFAGAETANAFAGYMEGAVRSAEMIFQRIITDL